MAAPDYEYVVLKFSAGTISHMSERMNDHAEKGYEPVMMCGDSHTTILLRRPKQEKPEAE